MLATTLLIRVVRNIDFWKGNYRDKDMPRYDLTISIFNTIRYIVPSLQMTSQWRHHNKTHRCYSELNYVQNLYFGFFIFWKLTELCRFVTYLWDDPQTTSQCNCVFCGMSVFFSFVSVMSIVAALHMLTTMLRPNYAEYLPLKMATTEAKQRRVGTGHNLYIPVNISNI